jgi:hypothetical protein
MNEELTEALTEVQEHLGNPQDTQEKPAKITFDEAQQKRVDELIRRAQGRAAKDVRQELETTKAALEALRGQQGQQAVPNDVLTELSTTRAELAALRQQQTEAQIMSEIRNHTGSFVDAELAAQLIRQGSHYRAAMLDQWFHGGAPALGVGDILLPSTETGVVRSALGNHYRTRLYVTPSADLAALFAFLSHGKLYRVEPDTPPELDMETGACIRLAGPPAIEHMHYFCRSARIVEVLKTNVNKDDPAIRRLGAQYLDFRSARFALAFQIGIKTFPNLSDALHNPNHSLHKWSLKIADERIKAWLNSGIPLSEIE